MTEKKDKKQREKKREDNPNLQKQEEEPKFPQRKRTRRDIRSASLAPGPLDIKSQDS